LAQDLYKFYLILHAFRMTMSHSSKPQVGKLVAVTVSLVVIPLLLLALALWPAHADAAKHYTDLTFPPLPEIQLPQYQRFQLKNGMVVYLMEDHELPLVGGTAMIRTGERQDPPAEVGLAEVTTTVLRTGGTQPHPADQLNRILEQNAATIETDVKSNVVTVSFSSLSEDVSVVLGLFGEVLQQPAFAQDQLELAKVQQQGGIARRNDDPDSIASREFRKLLYGADSPYARTIEYATLSQISQPDLVTFHQTWFQPQNVILGIVGDFDPKLLRAQIETAFENWKPSANARRARPPLPQVQQAHSQGLFFVEQPQLNQSYIQLGHLGGQADNPDYPALSVMNEVLSGFGGRLFNQIRSRQGLAYSVYASWSPQYDYPGVFVAGGETRSEATVGFVQAVKQEIERIRTQPITAEELQAAKDSVLNSFVFNFQDPAQTLSRLLRYEYFGYPEDFIFRYRKAVENTTIEDIQRVAKTYLQPDCLVTLVVGNSAVIQPALTELQPQVATIDITIPKP
jgi:zinc protease